MNQMEILKPPDLCSLLFSMKFKDTGQFSPALDQVKDKLPSRSFPILNLIQKKAILKDMKPEVSYTEVLKDHDYKYPCDEDFIAQLLAQSEIIEPAIDYFPIIVFHSCLAYLINTNETDNFNSGLKLLELLNKCIMISTTKGLIKTGTLSVSLYYLLYEHLIKYESDSDIKLLFQHLSTFLCSNDNLPKESFDLIIHTLRRVLYQGKFCKATNILANFIVIIIRTYGNRFPRNITQRILDDIRISILNLDEDALCFLTHILSYINQEDLMPFIKSFPIAIIAFLKQNIEENSVILNSDQSLYVVRSIQLPTLYTLINTETSFIPRKATFPPSKPIETILTPEIQKIVHHLVKIISKAKEEFTTSLMQQLEPDLSFDVVTTFLYILSELRPNVSLIPFVQSIICDTRVSIFRPSQFLVKFSSVRSLLFNLIFIQDRDNIQAAFTVIRNHPLLYAEFTYRIVNDESIILTFVQDISNEMFQAFQIYQMCDNKSEDVQIAKNTILNFFDQILQEEKYSKLYFSNESFIMNLVQLLFDSSIRSITIGIISRYIEETDEINHMLAAFLMNAFIKSFKFNYTEPELQHILDLLKFLNKFGEKCIPSFDKLSPSLCKWIAKIPHNQTSYHILNQSVDTFNTFIKTHTITPVETTAFEAAVKTVFGYNIPGAFLIKMLSLIAGRNVPEIQSVFIIKQPQALRLLLSVFMNTPRFNEAVNTVSNLCSYSPENIDICHRGELDLFLLDNIMKWRNSNEVSQTTIDSLLLLFNQIASNFSSVPVVHSFIKLLCLIDGKYLPKYQISFINALNELVKLSRKLPAAYLSEPSIQITGLDPSLASDFSQIIWICLASNTKDKFMRYQKESTSMSLKIDENVLVIEVSNDKCIITKKIKNVVFNINQWNLLVIKLVKPSAERISIKIIMNGKAFPDIPFDIVFDLTPEGNFDCEIIGSESIHIGPLGIIPTNKIDSYNFMEAGPRYVPRAQDKSIFLIPQQHSSLFSIHVLTKSKKLYANCNVTRTSNTQTFLDILQDRCGVAFLNPLFAQIDLTFNDNTKIPSMLPQLVDLIGNYLSDSYTGQKMFGQSNGFMVISHLISQADPRHINYDLYFRFYTILDVLEDTKCIINLIRYILINFQLWFKTTPCDHLKILQHWALSLVPTFIDYVSQVVNTPIMITIMRVYYWYQKESLISKDDRPKNLDIKKSRYYLFIICHLLARHSLSSKHVNIIIAHILTCKDNEQIDETITFLKKLLYENEKFDETAFLNLPYLHFAINNGYISYMQNILDLLIMAHKKDMIPMISMNEHFSLFMYSLDFDFSSKEVFDVISNMSKTIPELYPLAFFVALPLGDSCIAELIDNFHFNENIAQLDYWSLWPVMLLYINPSTMITESILIMLSSIPPEYWKQIYLMILSIGYILEKDYEDVLHSYLMTIIVHRISDEKSAQHFYSIARLFLFARMNEESDEYLLDLVAAGYPTASKKPKSSSMTPKSRSLNRVPPVMIPVLSHSNRPSPAHTPRKNGNVLSRRNSQALALTRTYSKSIKPTPEQLIGFSPAELVEKFKQCSQMNNKMHFGIRRCKDGVWIDSDIASHVLIGFKRYPVHLYDDLVILICAFQLYKQYVSDTDALKLTRPSELPPLNAISIYNKCAKATNSPFLDDAKYIPDHFLYLQKMDEEFSSLVESFIMDLASDCFISTERGIDMKETMEADFGNISIDVIQEILEGIHLDNVHGAKEWSHFWHLVTSDRAPWNLSLPAKMREEAHYKRDSTSCFAYCPMKVRKNRKYTDHKKESIARDHGSVITAEQIYLQLQKDLKARYAENEPPAIFDLIEEPEDNDQSYSFVEGNKILELECELITLARIVENTLFILQKDNIILSCENQSVKVISLDKIAAIYLRTHLHRETAIEIFEKNGNTYFINFTKIKAQPVLKSFFSKSVIPVVQKTDFKTFFHSQPYMQMWLNHSISTFEYLILLNMMSGRSFHNVFQYPIFPWILSDYQSSELDLLDPKIYRDLSKPIGALNEERLNDLLEHYKSYEENGMKPYLYSNAPISPLSLYMYLLRQEPFTTLHIDMQSGRFDNPARLFASIEASFRIVNNTSGDFRELVPEFFFSPEFLENKNDFDLGTVNQVPIGDVVLPPWAHSPIDFVYKNRMALESDYVSAHITDWIDLIWGEKSRGQKAIEANNVYKPDLYPGVWETEEGQDPDNRPQIEATLSYVGQIPQQLFDKPHQHRSPMPQPSWKFPKIFSIALTTADIVMANFFMVSPVQLKIVLVDREAKMFSIFADFSSVATESAKKVKRKASMPLETQSNELGILFSFTDIQLDQKMVVFKKKPVHCCMGNNQFCMISNETIIISPESGCVPLRHRNNVITVGFDYNEILVVDDESKVSVYKENNLKYPYISIQTFHDVIKCCDISRTFKMIVCCTKDNYLMICSINKKTTMRDVKLDAEPDSVIITKAWGFILVSLHELREGQVYNYLELFTVNGDFIRKIEIESPIVSLTTWRSNNGFDYVIYSDELNRVFVFEAYFLQMSRIPMDSDQKIVKLFYLSNEATLIAVCENSKIMFVPFTPK